MTIRTLSTLLIDLKNDVKDSHISIEQILDQFHERGFGFFLFIFALPAALPLPAVGVGTILGLPLLFIAGQQVLKRPKIWMPRKMNQISITKEKLDTIIDASIPWMERLEILLKPRLEFMTSAPAQRLIGIAGFMMALSVLLPLPLTNTVPALGIALMAVGILMRDGLAVLVGAFTGTAWVTMLVTVTILFGSHGIELIKEFIKSWL